MAVEFRLLTVAIQRDFLWKITTEAWRRCITRSSNFCDPCSAFMRLIAQCYLNNDCNRVMRIIIIWILLFRSCAGIVTGNNCRILSRAYSWLAFDVSLEKLSSPEYPYVEIQAVRMKNTAHLDKLALWDDGLCHHPSTAIPAALIFYRTWTPRGVAMTRLRCPLFVAMRCFAAIVLTTTALFLKRGEASRPKRSNSWGRLHDSHSIRALRSA